MPKERGDSPVVAVLGKPLPVVTPTASGRDRRIHQRLGRRPSVVTGAWSHSARSRPEAAPTGWWCAVVWYTPADGYTLALLVSWKPNKKNVAGRRSYTGSTGWRG